MSSSHPSSRQSTSSNYNSTLTTSKDVAVAPKYAMTRQCQVLLNSANLGTPATSTSTTSTYTSETNPFRLRPAVWDEEDGSDSSDEDQAPSVPRWNYYSYPREYKIVAPAPMELPPTPAQETLPPRFKLRPWKIIEAPPPPPLPTSDSAHGYDPAYPALYYSPMWSAQSSLSYIYRGVKPSEPTTGPSSSSGSGDRSQSSPSPLPPPSATPPSHKPGEPPLESEENSKVSKKKEKSTSKQSSVGPRRSLRHRTTPSVDGTSSQDSAEEVQVVLGLISAENPLEGGDATSNPSRALHREDTQATLVSEPPPKSKGSHSKLISSVVRNTPDRKSPRVTSHPYYRTAKQKEEQAKTSRKDTPQKLPLEQKNDDGNSRTLRSSKVRQPTATPKSPVAVTPHDDRETSPVPAPSKTDRNARPRATDRVAPGSSPNTRSAVRVPGENNSVDRVSARLVQAKEVDVPKKAKKARHSGNKTKAAQDKHEHEAKPVAA
ncbi:hypothetical protein BDN72DRAFT_849916 [Pluteus cervinus]|uniref:Uncharacterized protein n=1 Tax=Pluteus cervinus TaxID=181527 RepID=A0ACD3A5Q9_9AGAR|nr:hypothetical protein BDN72DRAFT_849916 [Pluteus cervinus]